MMAKLVTDRPGKKTTIVDLVDLPDAQLARLAVAGSREATAEIARRWKQTHHG